MKKTQLLILPAILFFAACTPNPYPGFNQTEDGLFYKFHVSGDGIKPKTGDYTYVFIKYTDASGEVYLDNRGGEALLIPIFETSYPGDIYDALKMMSEGDSATFLIGMSDFFELTAGTKLPPEVEGDGKLTFEIKMDKVKTREQMVAAEMQTLSEFLSENNITTPANPSGLIFIEDSPGRGPLAVAGDTVSVHYRGTLLDGTVFDSSLERNEPFEFELGKGVVIQGWEEGLNMMREGGKARLIIPSSLGYGNNDLGAIGPYSTLMFEVELIDIK